MTLREIAETLVNGCRNHTESENLGRLYASDAVSVEAMDNGMGREARGLDAIRGKHAWWNENMEMISGSVSDPMLHPDDRFAVVFDFKGREKANGKEFEMKEVAVYTVAGDKIVREEFFY